MGYADIQDKGFDSRSTEELQQIARLGGINSGIVRKQKASFRNSLNKILNSGIKLPADIQDKDIKDYISKLESIGIDMKNVELIDLMTLGQVLGAIGGKNDNYRTLLELNGELLENNEDNPTPSLQITLKDNSHLEKTLYEENMKSNEENKH